MTPRISTGLAVTFFIVVLGVVIWLGLPANSEPVGDRLVIVTTIYPLADFAQNIGGDLVDVRNIVPAGAEPHDYEPTPREVAQLFEADLVLYLGGSVDAWLEDVADEHVPLMKLAGSEADPHIWLDPVAAQSLVVAIRDALIGVDAAHAADYQANAEAYIASLKDLDAAFAASLDQCELDDIIVSHDAFGYLARRYDFSVHAISGLSPEAEPSVRDLAELAEKAQDLGVETIFFETLVSPSLAETLAEEIGADTAVLNPLEGLTEEELQSGESYLTIMNMNLQALQTAMLCQ